MLYKKLNICYNFYPWIFSFPGVVFFYFHFDVDKSKNTLFFKINHKVSKIKFNSINYPLPFGSVLSFQLDFDKVC